MDDVPEGKWFMQLCKGMHIETCTYFKVFFKVIGRFQMKLMFNSTVLSQMFRATQAPSYGTPEGTRKLKSFEWLDCTNKRSFECRDCTNKKVSNVSTAQTIKF